MILQQPWALELVDPTKASQMMWSTDSLRFSGIHDSALFCEARAPSNPFHGTLSNSQKAARPHAHRSHTKPLCCPMALLTLFVSHFPDGKDGFPTPGLPSLRSCSKAGQSADHRFQHPAKKGMTPVDAPRRLAPECTQGLVARSEGVFHLLHLPDRRQPRRRSAHNLWARWQRGTMLSQLTLLKMEPKWIHVQGFASGGKLSTEQPAGS